MPEFEELAAGLRAWAAGADAGDRAAVELLIANRTWLEREDFFAAAIGMSGGLPYVSWRRAQAFDGYGSGGELAVLRAACLIGDDPLRFYVLDGANRQLVASAFATALGVTSLGESRG
jgi:hypothetical protein